MKRSVLAVVGALALVGVQSAAAGGGSGAPAPAMERGGAALRADTVRFEGCSTDQVVTLKDAMATAAAALDESLRQLHSGATGRNFEIWFGRSDPRQVAGVLESIRTRLGSAEPMHVECSSPVDCEGGNFAYSESGGTAVGFCDAFFEMPERGFDSRFGTVIHELSHMVAGTEDHVYGVENAQGLAAKSSDHAATNADNYEYFVESGQDGAQDPQVGWSRNGGVVAGSRAGLAEVAGHVCKWTLGGQCGDEAGGGRR